MTALTKFSREAREQQNYAGSNLQYFYSVYCMCHYCGFPGRKKGKKSLTLLNNGYVCECLKNWSTRWKRFISQKVPGTLSITAHTILCPGKTHMLPKCTKTNKVFSNKTFRRYTAIQKGYSIGEEAQCRQKGAQHQLI